MNTIGFISYIYNGWSLEGMAESAGKHGLTCIQLDPRQRLQVMDDKPLSPVRAEQIREQLEGEGITIAALSGYTNLIHPDPGKRESKLQQFERMIELCPAYSTQYIATETGTLHPTNSWRDWEGNKTEEAWGQLLKSVDRLRNYAVKRGVVILLEGFVSNVLARPAQGVRMLETLGTEGLAFVMDPFNYMSRDDMERQQEAMDAIFHYIGKYCPIAHAKDTLYTEEGIKTPRVGAGQVQWELYASLLRQKLPDVPLLLEHAAPDEVGLCLQIIRDSFDDGCAGR